MIPIYRSDGEWVAVYEQGHLFTYDGEWLGFVVGREAFDLSGEYIGFLSDDRRLLRLRNLPDDIPKRVAPLRPARPVIPTSFPLAPLLRVLPYQVIDVFEEFPDRFLFVSETRPDME